VRTTRTRTRGHTLNELMVVIGIIMIVASRSLPSLLQAKLSGNETAAIGALRTVQASEQLHVEKTGALGTLVQLKAAGLTSLTSEPRSGYRLSVHVGSTPDQLVAVVWPTAPGVTGARTFVITGRGVIAWTYGQVITGADDSAWFAASPIATSWDVRSLVGWYWLSGGVVPAR
jgi:Tfp pilus assembly protein PilE